MVKKRVFISLIIVLAIVLIASMLLLGNFSNEKDTEALFNDKNVNIVQTAGVVKTQITPKLYFKYVVIGYPEVHNPLQEITNGTVLEYNGQSNILEFSIKWQENVTTNNPTLTYYQKINDDYVQMQDGKKPLNAGDYKIVISLEDDNYEVNPLAKEFIFTIEPFACELKPITQNVFIYNGLSQSPTIEAVGAVVPDDKFWDEKIQKKDKITGEYVDHEKAITVGEYRVKIDLKSPNYKIVNKDDIELKYYNFTIKPTYVDIKPQLDSYTYSAQEKILSHSVIGVCLDDVVNVSFKYFIGDKEVSAIKDAGDYKLVGTSDNENYLVRDSFVKVNKKSVNVKLVLPEDLTYDGSNREVKILQEGLYDVDNVRLIATYNGTTEKPCKAGNYEISYTPEGDRKVNYIFNEVTTYMTINKAQYKISGFDVIIHAIKVIVIVDDDFKDLEVRYSLDKKNWQKEPSIEAEPMHEYTVYVKILEDENHFEKILSKKVKTGFDPVIFDAYMNDVNIDNFTFTDVAKYNKILGCIDFITKADEENVDYVKLESIKTAYNEYVKKTQGVLDNALEVTNSLKYFYMSAAPITIGAVALGIAIRRKKNEK